MPVGPAEGSGQEKGDSPAPHGEAAETTQRAVQYMREMAAREQKAAGDSDRRAIARSGCAMPKLGPSSDNNLRSRPVSAAIESEPTLEQQWSALTREDLGSEAMEKLAARGVPPRIRARVWARLLGLKSRRRRRPRAFEAACARQVDRKIKHVIESDLGRTFPKSAEFHAPGAPYPARLKTALYAFAAHDPEIQYTQGMNCVGGLLALVLPSPEDVFWALDSVCRDPKTSFSRLYAPPFPMLREFQYILNRLLLQHRPELHARFAAATRALALPRGVLGYVIPKWILSVFTFLPMRCALRVWDVLVAQGIRFLFKLSLFALSRLPVALRAYRREQGREKDSMAATGAQKTPENQSPVRVGNRFFNFLDKVKVKVAGERGGGGPNGQFHALLECIRHITKYDKIWENDPDTVISEAMKLGPTAAELAALRRDFDLVRPNNYDIIAHDCNSGMDSASPPPTKRAASGQKSKWQFRVENRSVTSHPAKGDGDGQDRKKGDLGGFALLPAEPPPFRVDRRRASSPRSGTSAGTTPTERSPMDATPPG